jgi:hypothetical protein
MMRADDWSTPIVLKCKATIRAPFTRSSTEIYQFGGAYGRLAAWRSVSGLIGAVAKAEVE